MISRVLIVSLLVFATITLFRMAMISIPINITNTKDNTIAELQKTYQISPKMATAVYNAHVVSGYNPKFIAELVLSESGFNPNAISPKGYKGVLQTPTKTGYVNADMVHGVEILMEKFKTYGDVVDAIAAYKGGKDKPMARLQARAFLQAYNNRYTVRNQI